MLRIIMQVVSGIVVVGLIIALLRVFDWDIVALIEWVFDFIFTITNKIADMFSNNDTFKNIVKK